MSSIPVPQTVKRPRTGLTQPGATSAGPSRLREPTTRSVSATRVPATTITTTARRAPATVSRAPMSNSTNRVPTAATRTVTSAKSAVAARTVTRRTVSGNQAQAVGDADPSRMDAMESRLATMQELFDLERQKTEEKWNRERQERLAQEDKVRQLEEDLREQQKIAQSRQEEIKRRRTLADDELLQLNAKHQREKRLLEEELDRERSTVAALKATLSQQSTAHLTMESTNTAMRTQISTLQDEIEQLRARIAAMDKELAETREYNASLENDLREAESLRRKLHNEVQELRGNIRVFARVRPANHNDANNGSEALATIRFPNEREASQIEVLATGESATGTVTMKNHMFTFDRVFQPAATQADVFEEIAHLTQSVLDGYNVSMLRVDMHAVCSQPI